MSTSCSGRSQLADAELIGRSLRPYLDGRDWVSINRGEVIDVDRLVGGH